MTNTACRKSKLIIHQADCDRDTACGHVFWDKPSRDSSLLLCSISITNIFSLLRYGIFEIRSNKAKMRDIAIDERRYSHFDIQHYEQKRLSNSQLILPEKNAGALWKVISRQSKDPKADCNLRIMNFSCPPNRRGLFKWSGFSVFIKVSLFPLLSDSTSGIFIFLSSIWTIFEWSL